MTDEQALKRIEKAIRQNTRAEYILGEVEAYLVRTASKQEEDFKGWLRRHLDKYRKGEKW